MISESVYDGRREDSESEGHESTVDVSPRGNSCRCKEIVLPVLNTLSLLPLIHSGSSKNKNFMSLVLGEIVPSRTWSDFV